MALLVESVDRSIQVCVLLSLEEKYSAHARFSRARAPPGAGRAVARTTVGSRAALTARRGSDFARLRAQKGIDRRLEDFGVLLLITSHRDLRGESRADDGMGEETDIGEPCSR
jgi:hypothetical protein